jgi:cytochrome c oxidase subunit 1
MRPINIFGLVRGLIGYFVGLVVGMVAVMAILRLVLWHVGVGAGIGLGGRHCFAIIGFLLGVGAMTDWLKWTRGIATPMRHGPPPGKPAWTRYFGVDYNHKVIGIQYGVTGAAAADGGRHLALIFRTELAEPASVFAADTYNTSSACTAGWRWPRSCWASAAWPTTWCR